MKIYELLRDDDLYQLCQLMANTLPRDIQEGSRRPITRSPRIPVRKKAVRRAVKPSLPKVPVKPFPRPKPLYPERTQLSPGQKLATNPKIDPLMGFNARLDDVNVWPELNDTDKQLAGIARPYHKRR